MMTFTQYLKEASDATFQFAFDNFVNMLKKSPQVFLNYKAKFQAVVDGKTASKLLDWEEWRFTGSEFNDRDYVFVHVKTGVRNENRIISVNRRNGKIEIGYDVIAVDSDNIFDKEFRYHLLKKG